MGTNGMDDIQAPISSRDSNWNYVACSPFSEVYQQMPILDKFNTVRFDGYYGTTDPDKRPILDKLLFTMCPMSNSIVCFPT